ncbi:MAG: hypothetical protein IJF76_01010 [Clostridia bacterium]|nr:hypothetical protein [Clostridia bacterium]
MTERRLAEIIIDNALRFHDDSTGLKPSLVIDKEDYSDFNIEEVKKVLEEYGFDLVDGTQAPPPFCEMEEDFKSRKWYIYQIE